MFINSPLCHPKCMWLLCCCFFLENICFVIILFCLCSHVLFFQKKYTFVYFVVILAKGNETGLFYVHNFRIPRQMIVRVTLSNSSWWCSLSEGGGELHEPPADIDIVIEGVKVLNQLTSVTSACALLLGMKYINL